MSPRSARLALLSISCLAVACLPGAAPAAPMCDVPDDHPAASDVRTLWEAGILRGTGGGRFRGDRQIRRAEAICLAARLSVAVNEELVRRSGDSIDTVLKRWSARGPHHPENPYPAGHWAAREWQFLRDARPADLDVLEGWPDPLPTRYEAAVSAARVLRRAREAAATQRLDEIDTELHEAGAESNPTEALDWVPEAGHDHEGEAGPGDGPPDVAPEQGGVPLVEKASLSTPE